MSSPSSSNHEGNDAWLMKIELKREEPMEINKDEGIKKATEDQALATEDILQLDHNLLTPTKYFSRVRYLFCIRDNSIILKASISVGVRRL